MNYEDYKALKPRLSIGIAVLGLVWLLIDTLIFSDLESKILFRLPNGDPVDIYFLPYMLIIISYIVTHISFYIWQFVHHFKEGYHFEDNLEKTPQETIINNEH